MPTQVPTEVLDLAQTSVFDFDGTLSTVDIGKHLLDEGLLRSVAPEVPVDPAFAPLRLEFPHEDRCCACSSCGTCKQAPVKDARYRGRTTVLAAVLLGGRP
jgi:hypothetical protein